MMYFTENQQKALDVSGSKNFLVSASAGTGKTTVMVTRINDIICKKRVPVSRFMVVTFTNLAAAQMREKLYKMLAESGDDFAFAERENIDAASISTLHSFCADLVREYFYVVNCDPDFAVMEESEAAKLFDDALTAVFDKHFKEDDDFLILLDMYGKNRSDKGLKVIVGNLYEFGSCTESLADWYAQSFDESKQKKAVDFFNEQLIYKSRRYKQECDCVAVAAKKAGIDIVAEHMSEIAGNLSASDKNDLKANAALLCAVTYKQLRITEKNCAPTCDPDTAQNIIDIAKNLKDEVKKFTKESAEFLDVDFDDGVKDYGGLLVKLAAEVGDEYSRLKRDRNGVDFNDLERLALEVLQDEQTCKAVRDRYDYVFVDEYQDINDKQEAILNKVSRADNFYAVGDVKQSIYGFRQSDPEIFRRRNSAYADDQKENAVVLMNDNFRCSHQLAEFVNAVFSPLMTNEFGGVDYAGTGRLEAKAENGILGQKAVTVAVIKRQKNTETLPTQGKIYDVKQTSEGKTSPAALNGKYIAAEIAKIVGKSTADGGVIRYGDIAVLVRNAKNEATEILKQLTEAGIPALVSAGDGAFKKEVRDAVAFLKVVDNPLDDFAFAQVMLSPIGGFTNAQLAVVAAETQSDDAKPCFRDRLKAFCDKKQGDLIARKAERFLSFLEEYKKKSAVLDADELLADMFERTEYIDYVCGLPNGDARVTNLLTFVGQLTGKSFCAAVSRLDYMQGADLRVAEQDSVKIMTIHAAKGLEFKTVFLARAGRDFNPDSDVRAGIILSKQLGVCAHDYDESTMTICDGKRFVLAGKIEKIKNKEEELRLLYVAATRAKSKLYIVFDEKETEKLKFSFCPEDSTKASRWIKYALYKNGFYTGDFALGDIVEVVETSENALQKTVVAAVENDQMNIEELKKNAEWVYPFADTLDLPLKVASSQLDEHTYFGFDDENDVDDEFKPSKILAEDEPVDKTLLGKAYHKVFERCDLTDSSGVENTLCDVVARGFVDQATADAVDIKVIKKCLDGDKFKALLKDKKAYREMPFLTLLPYNEIFGEGGEEKITVQGVIDLLLVGENDAIVVDFKVTEHPEYIKKNYAMQIKSYCLAASKILGLPAKGYVLSVLDGKIVEF